MTKTRLSDPSIKSAPKTDSLRAQQKRGPSSHPQRNNTNSDILNSGRPTSYASWPDVIEPGTLEDEERTDRGTPMVCKSRHRHKHKRGSHAMDATPWVQGQEAQKRPPLNPTSSQEQVH